MKIAVVGAGLAGLTAAWLLGRQHAVTLFERHPQPGFTAANVAVPGRGAAGNPVRVDVPLRVFYPGYYPTLTRLYQALGVPSEPVSYAASFHGPALAGRDAQALYFRYRNLGWGGRSHSLPAPQDLLLGAPAWRIVAGALRFNRQAVAALHAGALAGQSLGEHLAARDYPLDFVDGFLLPALATVCTCSLAQARALPAEVVVDYLARGLAHQAVQRALHGADDVQRRLLAGIPGLRAGVALQAVGHGADGAMQAWLADGSCEHFDHLVLATPAHQARALLGAADARSDARAGADDLAAADEAAALAGFDHAQVAVLTHGDASLMPARRRDWSPVNLWVDSAAGEVESTIWVNAVQPVLRGAPDVFQTVNPLRPVAAGRVHGQARFERPVVQARSQQALAALQRLQARPGRRLWFCGAHAQAGIPLLESAVRSAFEVAARLGVALPGEDLLLGDRAGAGPV